MVKKLLFSLLGLLSSVVALWGVVRLGWTYEMFGPAALSMVFFAVALAVGNARPERTHGRFDPHGAGPEGRVTQRYGWGDLTPWKST